MAVGFGRAVFEEGGESGSEEGGEVEVGFGALFD